jgi:hypothetical protein
MHVTGRFARRLQRQLADEARHGIGSYGMPMVLLLATGCQVVTSGASRAR